MIRQDFFALLTLLFSVVPDRSGQADDFLETILVVLGRMGLFLASLPRTKRFLASVRYFRGVSGKSRILLR